MRSFCVTTLLLLLTSFTWAQVGIGTTSPDASARLQVDANASTNAKGFLPPRVTSIERGNIATPAAGLLVYQTDGTAGLYYYDGSSWIYIINSTTSTLPVAKGGTGVTTSTGSGSVVLSTSPTLTTPVVSSGSSEYPNSLHILPPTHATSKRTSLRIDEWLLYQDISANGTKNFTITERDGGNFTSRMFINVGGNVGIGNTSPNAKLDIRANPTSASDPGTGYLGIGTTSAAANTAGAGAVRYNTSGALEYSNGSSWTTLAIVNFGDIKTGIQSSDHNGWIKLDGRLKSSLTATQQAQATSLGIGTNLPNATDAYLVQNGSTLGSVSGSNQTTIAQSNLPNVTFTGTAASNGSHSHSGTTSTNGSHTHSLSVDFSATNAYWNWTPYANSAGFTQVGNASTSSSGSHNHSLNINSDGAHTHSVSVSSGGSGTAINIAPKSLSVNTFIYLGL